jgi:hypothetical protein
MEAFMTHRPLFDALHLKSFAELEEVMRAGTAPDPKDLDGWLWRGWSPAPWIALLGIRKFMKGFFTATPGLVEGYNVPVRQNAYEEEWVAKAPPFGFYHCVPPAPPADLHPNSLLIHYAVSPRNAFWKPERMIRDYVVRVDSAEPDVLLGKAVFHTGLARVQTSFFLLERKERASWKP